MPPLFDAVEALPPAAGAPADPVVVEPGEPGFDAAAVGELDSDDDDEDFDDEEDAPDLPPVSEDAGLDGFVEGVFPGVLGAVEGDVGGGVGICGGEEGDFVAQPETSDSSSTAVRQPARPVRTDAMFMRARSKWRRDMDVRAWTKFPSWS